MNYLAADIGGTNVRVAIYDEVDDVLYSRTFNHVAESFDSMLELLSLCVEEANVALNVAVVGVCKPVINGQVDFLNTGRQSFGIEDLQHRLGVRVGLYNDVALIAAAIPRLTRDDVRVLLPGTVIDEMPAVAIGWGTGSNDAILLPTGLVATEGTYIPFAPRNKAELNLLEASWEKAGRDYIAFCGYISGRYGFRFLLDIVREVIPLEASIADELQEAGPAQEGPIIVRHGLAGDPTCRQVLVHTGNILGTYIGARVLSAIALGGVYLAGGIGSNTALFDFIMNETEFHRRIRDVGPDSELIAGVPVFQVTCNDPALVGAQAIARQLLNS